MSNEEVEEWRKEFEKTITHNQDTREPETLHDIVGNILDLVGSRKGLIFMYAPDVVGCVAGKEHIRILPEKVLKMLSNALGTEVRVAPKDAYIDTTRIEPPCEDWSCFGHSIAKLGRFGYDVHCVGTMEYVNSDPQFWGYRKQSFRFDMNGLDELDSYLKRVEEKVLVWQVTLPVLVLIVEPEAPKRITPETLKEIQERQLEFFNSLDTLEDSSECSSSK